MWSIYKKSQAETPGTEAWEMLNLYPHAACHDGTNVVFVSTHPNADDPFILPVTTDDSSLIMFAATFLFQEQVHAMHLTKSQAKRLFRHPAHRLWCARYEEDQRDLFESDYNANRNFALSLGSDLWPEYSEELTPEQARQIMLNQLASTEE